MVKECKICHVVQDEEQFFTCGSYKDKVYRRGECITCHNSGRIGKNNDYHKEYRNRPEIKEKRKLYKQQKRQEESYKEKQRAFERNKYDTNEIYRLKKCLRGRIKRALESKRWAKTNKTEEYLGCTYEELKNYLTSLFHSGMTWDNHGEYWEIDHIESLGQAQTVEEIYKLTHYSNLKPLLKQDHRDKLAGDMQKIIVIKKEFNNKPK